MDFSNTEIRALWARSDLLVWDDEYYMVSLDPEYKNDALKLIASANPKTNYTSIVCDQNEVAVILPDHVWKTRNSNLEYRTIHGPLKCLTFDVPLNIEVSGYLKPAIEVLAAHKISVIVQCAYVYDHIFIQTNDLDKTVEVLKLIQNEATNPSLK